MELLLTPHCLTEIVIYFCETIFQVHGYMTLTALTEIH